MSVNKVVRALSTVCMRIKCFVPINKSRLGGRTGEICRGKGRGKRGMETGKGEREVECATD